MLKKGTAETFSIEIAEIRYYWDFILLEMLKQGTAEYLIYLKY